MKPRKDHDPDKASKDNASFQRQTPETKKCTKAKTRPKVYKNIIRGYQNRDRCLILRKDGLKTVLDSNTSEFPASAKLVQL